ncbi:DUF1642 domain-containing protein [Listeria monocytogenes]|nr:DUF1642 domain-containing protein [Listeria monocytogenes]EAC8456626.1 DUF1642 domain-containing protein [Listeria monocytogenes]EAE1360056.1 DUF1642 domain-containing protein [Listeria monocytogenes]EAE1362340.1 DUF1642 domain-containing protein [Listeria monocytogenes]EAF8796432.1 DUF1642 domain-containing protein [Listeria monocytogenes]
MRFKEGDKVEFIWLGELIQGVVTEIKANNFNISYLVKSEFIGTLRVTERELAASAPVLKVPQFVADWYEKNKCDLEYSIWKYIRNWDYHEEDGFFNFMNDNDNESIKTLIKMQNGYEVEKEPLYYVKLPISKRNESTDELEVINMCLLLNIQSHETFISGNYRWVDKLKRTGWRTKLTEAQIKDMPEGDAYWQFAVPVRDLECEA